MTRLGAGRSKRRGDRGQGSTEGFLQLGRRARFDGRLEGQGLALVHGELTGEVELDGDLLVATDGRLRELRGVTTRLRVEGHAISALTVLEALEVAAGGLLEGEVRASRLEASPGARIEALLRIVPEPPEEGAAG